MRTERNDAIAGREIAYDRRGFIAEAANLHRTPSHPRIVLVDEPYAGTGARIEDGTDRDLQGGRGPAVRYLHGDRSAERRVCQRTLQHVPGLKSPRLTVCSLRQLAKFRDARHRAAIQGRDPRRSGRRTQSFGKLDDRFTAPGVRHTHDDLSGTDDLTRLRQRLDDD